MNEIATAVEQPTQGFNTAMVFTDPARLQSVIQFAEMMSKAVVTVPKHLVGKPSDCLAITLQAMRWGMDPFVVAQKTHLINGNLGYEAQLVVAVLKSSSAVRGRPHYEYRGDGAGLECRAGFVPAGENDVVWTEWLADRLITVKNSPLWKNNPKQQFGYLQARNWARLYAPEAMLGVYTTDELEAVDATTGEIVQTRGMPKTVAPPMVERVEPPTWPAEAFATQLPRWTRAVAGGMKTAADILALARSKGALTGEQEEQIAALKPAPVEPAAEVDPFVAEMDAAEREGASA